MRTSGTNSPPNTQKVDICHSASSVSRPRMSSNRLRLNPSKTELIWLGTSRRLQHCGGFNMTVCGADVRPVNCVRDLGVLIDSNMTRSNHVNNHVAGICFYQLRQFGIIRRSLTTDAAHFCFHIFIFIFTYV